MQILRVMQFIGCLEHVVLARVDLVVNTLDDPI